MMPSEQPPASPPVNRKLKVFQRLIFAVGAVVVFLILAQGFFATQFAEITTLLQSPLHEPEQSAETATPPAAKSAEEEAKPTVMITATVTASASGNAIPQDHAATPSEALDATVNTASTQTPVDRPIATDAVLKYEISVEQAKKLKTAVVAFAKPFSFDQLPTVRWQDVPGTSEYSVEWSSEIGFANVSRIDGIKFNTYQPQLVKIGTTYFRVRAKLASGDWSEPSEIIELQCFLPAPRLDPITERIVNLASREQLSKLKPHVFNLHWPVDSAVDHYEILWGKDRQFTESKTFFTRSNEFRVRVQSPSQYAARVRALNHDGEPISDFSEIRTATYDFNFPQPTTADGPSIDVAIRPEAASKKSKSLIEDLKHNSPSLLKPLQNIAVPLKEREQLRLTFSWEVFAMAESYDVQWSLSGDFDEIFAEAKTTKTALVFAPRFAKRGREFPEGKVFWRVRARFAGQLSEWSEPRTFEIIFE